MVFHDIRPAMAAAAMMALGTMPAQAQQNARAMFQSRYDSLRAMPADALASSGIYADTFVMTDIRGETHTRAEMIEVRKRVGSTDGISPAIVTVRSATIAGNVATVQQTTTIRRTRNGEDGKPEAAEMVIQSTDTWARAGSTWTIRASVQKDLIVKRNGTVFLHQTR